MHNFFIILSVYGKVTPLGGTLPPAIHVEAISHKCAKHQVCLLLAVSNSEFINLSYAALLLSAVVYTGYATKYACRTSPSVRFYQFLYAITIIIGISRVRQLQELNIEALSILSSREDGSQI